MVNYLSQEETYFPYIHRKAAHLNQALNCHPGGHLREGVRLRAARHPDRRRRGAERLRGADDRHAAGAAGAAGGGEGRRRARGRPPRRAGGRRVGLGRRAAKDQAGVQFNTPCGGHLDT